jgi:hypothetical protein
MLLGRDVEEHHWIAELLYQGSGNNFQTYGIPSKPRETGNGFTCKCKKINQREV